MGDEENKAKIITDYVKYNKRGSFHPAGFSGSQPLIKGIDNLPPPEIQDQNEKATPVAEKNISYLPPGMVIGKPHFSTENQDDNKEAEIIVKPVKTYKPPKFDQKPLVNATDLPIPTSVKQFHQDMEKEEYRRRALVLSEERSQSVNGARTSTRKSISKINKRQSYLSAQSHSSRYSAKPTLINLEAGMVGQINRNPRMKLKAKKLNNAVVASLQPDKASFFLDTETMAYLRGFWMFVAISYMAWYVYYDIHHFIMSFVGWYWVALFLYYLLSFAETVSFMASSQKPLFPYAPRVIDMLFISTTTMTIIVPLFYWIFRFYTLSMAAIGGKSGALTNFDILDIVGAHLGIFAIIPEVTLSRRTVEKLYGFVPCTFVLVYLFFAWLMHYQFHTAWPEALAPFFEKWFSIDFQPVTLLTVLLIVIMANIAALILVYNIVMVREKFQDRRAKDKSKQSSLAES